MKRLIKILIADDHELVRDGLKSLLLPEDWVEVLGEASNGQEVLDKIKSLPELDMVLMDINMPVKDGIETTKEIKELHPEVAVLILTMYNRREFVKNLIASGADGYMLKNSGKNILLEAIQSLAKGEPYYEREITKTVMSTFKSVHTYSKPTDVELSEREKDVIRLIYAECSTDQIADRLFISKHTVNTHRKNILSKLDVKNVAGIIKYAIQTGIVKAYES
jgi:DNA-binding NarL/FixJ family response regulator